VADVLLAPVDIASAWNVQGARAAHAAERRFGLPLPHVPNTVNASAELTSLWLGPGSWLLVKGGRPLEGYADARDALNAAGGALFDVTASRVAYAVSGPRAADVLAAGCPLDFHPRVFAVRACAQSVFARVNALYYRLDDGFIVLVARSFGRDVWHGLCAAAMEFGYVVKESSAWPGG